MGSLAPELEDVQKSAYDILFFIKKHSAPGTVCLVCLRVESPAGTQVGLLASRPWVCREGQFPSLAVPPVALSTLLVVEAARAQACSLHVPHPFWSLGLKGVVVNDDWKNEIGLAVDWS